MKKKSFKKLILILIVIFSIIILFFNKHKYLINDNLPELKKDTEIIVEEKNNNNSIAEVLNKNNELIDNKKEILEKEILEELLSQSYIFAIYGTDERSNEIPRSDIIMILKYEPKDNEILLVSIPRDTRVKIKNRGLDKINHAYAFGGPDLITQTLEEFLLVDIDYYIKLSFENFIELIDKIGGVKVNVKKDFYYPGYIDISEGNQVLSGEKALEYIRFRYDNDGDYGRIQRQQEVLRSLIEWQKSAPINKTESILKEIYNEIGTNMSIKSMKNFEKLLKVSSNNQFKQYTLDTHGEIIQGIWYEIYDSNSLKEIREILNKK